MASKFYTPTKTPNVLAAGGARKTRWGVLAVDSDSDSDRSLSPPPAPRKSVAPVTHGFRVTDRPAFFEPAPSPPRAASPVTPPSDLLRNFCQNDPVFLAMQRGDVLWGDLCYDPARDRAEAAVRRQLQFQEDRALEAHWNSEERALWQQPFAEKLETPFGDHFDLRGLSDPEYETFMRYIYAHGFYVEEYDRTHVYATPSTEEPRVWPRDTHGVGHGTSRFANLGRGEPACCNHSHGHSATHGRPPRAPAAGAMAAPGTDVGRRRGAPVPRFCRAAGACADEGCRYVHGDTIQRVNLPCNFGEGCGASDPTGVKRSQCLRMHPGEEWSADLVIRRIV